MDKERFTQAMYFQNMRGSCFFAITLSVVTLIFVANFSKYFRIQLHEIRTQVNYTLDYISNRTPVEPYPTMYLDNDCSRLSAEKTFSRYPVQNLTWPCLNGPNGCRIVTINTGRLGRLGNRMNGYVAVLAVARRLNATPYFLLGSGKKLEPTFNVSSLSIQRLENNTFYNVRHTESFIHKFSETLLAIPKNMNVRLNGFFHEWSLVNYVAPIVKKEFTFKENWQQQAHDFILTSIQNTFGQHVNPANYVVVGIHIRTGVNDLKGNWGYVHMIENATAYFTRAMKYFEERELSEKLIFIVCTDHFETASSIIKQSKAPMVFSMDHPASLDLCILTQCQHTVISRGTYSWWAGYLGHGTTVYNKGNDAIYYNSKRFWMTDKYHIPPWWVGL